MGKLDIGVGDEFPVDEPEAQAGSDDAASRDAREAAREEWRQQKDEWRRHRDAWRSQRHAWKEDMRMRGRAFKSDLRRSLRENFGGGAFRMPRGILPRLLMLLGGIALAIALLPFLFMFGFLALAVLFFAGALRSGRRDDYRTTPPQAP